MLCYERCGVSMINPLLERAVQCTNEQIARLRGLLHEVGARLEPAASDLRQLARTLDEIQLRIGVLKAQGQPSGVFERQASQLLARQQSLTELLTEDRRTQRALEQLVRQTEMSSGVLHGQDNEHIDPWHEALKAQIIQGREDERLRLAREVHDGPAQVLAHVVLGLEHSLSLSEQGRPERLESHLRELRNSTRMGLQEVRRFITDLRPPALEERGLQAALEAMAQRFTGAEVIAVHCEGDTLPRLLPEHEIVLYRIVQEALNNASKHAPHSMVAIRSEVSVQGVTLLIRDNGPGFDPRTISARTKGQHWGLASMHERADLIGARLKISSAPGQGTTVAVVGCQP